MHNESVLGSKIELKSVLNFSPILFRISFYTTSNNTCTQPFRPTVRRYKVLSQKGNSLILRNPGCGQLNFKRNNFAS